MLRSRYQRLSQRMMDHIHCFQTYMPINARRRKDVARIRLLMRNTGTKERRGCSWVQGKKGNSTFFVGDMTHPMSQEIYEKLAELIKRIKDMGYVPKRSFALHDVMVRGGDSFRA